MNKFLKDCVTGIDGESYDIGRAALALVSIGFVVFAGWAVFHGKDFNPQDYGIGAGSILGGGGAGIAMKGKTEPQ